MSLIVSFTDYKNMAMLYVCTKHKYGKNVACEPDSIHVMIISRSVNPADKNVNKYLQRAVKRLCGKMKDYDRMKTGQYRVV